MLAKAAPIPTRHREVRSLGLAVITAGTLAAFGDTQSMAVLVILNLLAVFSILLNASSVVRHADVLTHRFGEPYGSLILSLSIVLLEVSLISILMLSGAASATLMRDTVYSVTIIVLAGLVGLSLIFGGNKYKSQHFNLRGIKHYLISIIPLAVIVLVLPACLEGGAFNTMQLIVVGAVCLMMYAVFLKIQTRTHREFFLFEHEDGDGAHGHPSSHRNAWHFAFMGVHLVAVIGVTKLASTPLEALLTDLNAPAALMGLFVALLTLSPETTGALKAVMRNEVQRAMNLFLGSVLATISLTVPTVIVIAAFTGQPLTMGLDLPNIVILLCTFLVCQTSLTSGITNAHSGFAHMTLFIVYVMLLFR